MSFGPNSIEKFLASNSLHISGLKLSPININKRNLDLFSISNFQNSPTPIRNQRPLYDRNTIDLPFFSLSPIHIKPTQSSIFAPEIKAFEDTPKVTPVKGENINVNQLVIFNTKLMYFPIIHGLTEKDISISIIKAMKENCNVNILQKDKCSYSFYIRESILYSISDDELHEIRKVVDIDEEITLRTFRELIVYLLDKLKYTIHSVQLNYMLQKKKEINENLLLTCKKIIEKINTAVDTVMSLHSGGLLVSEKKEKLTSKKRPRLNDYSTPIKLPSAKVRISNSEDEARHFKESKPKQSFQCPFCDKVFDNGCALGGHMSRKHPHKSENYKQKLKIREQRNEYREAAQEAKEALMRKYDQSYFVARLYTDKEKKMKIKEMIQMHRKEYSELLHKAKKSRRLIN